MQHEGQVRGQLLLDQHRHAGICLRYACQCTRGQCERARDVASATYVMERRQGGVRPAMLASAGVIVAKDVFPGSVIAL